MRILILGPTDYWWFDRVVGLIKYYISYNPDSWTLVEPPDNMKSGVSTISSDYADSIGVNKIKIQNKDLNNVDAVDAALLMCDESNIEEMYRLRNVMTSSGVKTKVVKL